MYNAKYIVPGLLVFLGFATFPFWYNVASGSAKEPLVLKKAEGQCVLPAEQMRNAHMKMLNDWRDRVVRQGERVFKTEDGREFKMSLTNGCLTCHDSKAEFCDQCHAYSGVEPTCWSCHVDPQPGAAAHHPTGQGV